MGKEQVGQGDFHEEDLRAAKEKLVIPRKKYQGEGKAIQSGDEWDKYRASRNLEGHRRTPGETRALIALCIASVAALAMVAWMFRPGTDASRFRFGETVIFFRAEDILDRRGDAGPRGIGFAKIGDLARVVSDESSQPGPGRPVVVSVRDGNAGGWEGEVPRGSLRPYSGQ